MSRMAWRETKADFHPILVPNSHRIAGLRNPGERKDDFTRLNRHVRRALSFVPPHHLIRCHLHRRNQI